MRFIYLMISFFVFLNAGYSQQKVQRNAVSEKWDSYSNTRYGFTFQYPVSWVKNNQDVEAADRYGKVILLEINFTDTFSKTNLSVTYHLQPRGSELFMYQLSQFNSSKGLYQKGKKQMIIASSKAIEGYTDINRDGKGNKLNTALRVIVVDILDKK